MKVERTFKYYRGETLVGSICQASFECNPDGWHARMLESGATTREIVWRTFVELCATYRVATAIVR